MDEYGMEEMVPVLTAKLGTLIVTDNQIFTLELRRGEQVFVKAEINPNQFPRIHSFGIR